MFDTRLPGYFVPFGGGITNQANMMDTDETNPAEAESQSPGKSFLSKYIGGLGGLAASGNIKDLFKDSLAGQVLEATSGGPIGGLAGQALGTNSGGPIGGLVGGFLNQ